MTLNVLNSGVGMFDQRCRKFGILGLDVDQSGSVGTSHLF